MLTQAPSWDIDTWLNCSEPLSLERLRGKVIVLHAFQMLCPGCVSHGLPQAQRIHQAFAGEHLAVVGLHSVFEHHQAMTVTSLEPFVHEYRLGFPIAVDRPNGQGIPKTMAAYALQGTPSLVLIDQVGRIRFHRFGVIDDLILGAQIGALLQHPSSPIITAAQADATPQPMVCDTHGSCDPAFPGS